MLMGEECRRACRYCAVSTGSPHACLDATEAHNVAEAVALMGLRYVVLTSVDRVTPCRGAGSRPAVTH